ncbi:MAG: VanW family protein, partial [Clostridiales bacterium]|nr:VanW family protein [Clostridiales bacterium]
LDENKLYASIYCCLKFSGGGAIKATADEVSPSVTASELRRNLVLRGEYTTDFASSTAARAHNVTLALKKFDGMELRAGETLSFNGTVGERTAENGFQSAKIIVDGKYTDGVGGGVCQSSTALYNAALLAGLECSANAHSICPSYCPAGLDAMISNVSDLKIQNTTNRSIFISVKAASGKATVKMYGAPPEYKIVPESVTVKTVKFDEIETVDSERKYFGTDAVCGDRLLVALGKDGVVSETYLKYFKDGKFVKRVKIRVNEYKATPQIIAVAP